jgi:hypothetical protein
VTRLIFSLLLPCFTVLSCLVILSNSFFGLVDFVLTARRAFYEAKIRVKDRFVIRIHGCIYYRVDGWSNHSNTRRTSMEIEVDLRVLPEDSRELDEEEWGPTGCVHEGQPETHLGHVTLFGWGVDTAVVRVEGLVKTILKSYWVSAHSLIWYSIRNTVLRIKQIWQSLTTE